MLTDRFGVTWSTSARMSVPLDAALAALAEAMSALYNPAQRDVMTLAIELAPAEDGANTQA
ncbi:hypothetical protein GCM10027063_37630 [Promicromonospora xylanilytica]